MGQAHSRSDTGRDEGMNQPKSLIENLVYVFTVFCFCLFAVRLFIVLGLCGEALKKYINGY